MKSWMCTTNFKCRDIIVVFLVLLNLIANIKINKKSLFGSFYATR